MKTLEHCIYRNANDTRRLEVTMTGDRDGTARVKEDYSELMDVEHKVGFRDIEGIPTAWAYLDEQFKALRRMGFTYSPLPLDEVA